MTGLNHVVVQSRFPAVESGLVVLDNAGGSRIASDMARRLAEFRYTARVQPQMRDTTSATAGKIMHLRRLAVATLLNASHELAHSDRVIPVLAGHCNTSEQIAHLIARHKEMHSAEAAA